MWSRGLPISRFWTWQTRSTLLPWSVQAWRGLCDPQRPNACARKWHGRGSWKKIFSIKEVFSMNNVLNEIGEKCTPWDWNHIFHPTIFLPDKENAFAITLEQMVYGEVVWVTLEETPVWLDQAGTTRVPRKDLSVKATWSRVPNTT